MLCLISLFWYVVVGSVEVLSFDYEVVNESLKDDFGDIYDDEDDSNG